MTTPCPPSCRSRRRQASAGTIDFNPTTEASARSRSKRNLPGSRRDGVFSSAQRGPPNPFHAYSSSHRTASSGFSLDHRPALETLSRLGRSNAAIFWPHEGASVRFRLPAAQPERCSLPPHRLHECINRPRPDERPAAPLSSWKAQSIPGRREDVAGPIRWALFGQARSAR